MSYKIFEYDPYLKPFENDINQRMNNYINKKNEILQNGKIDSLYEFANGSNYFGFTKTKKGWFYREWAPNASAVYLMGDFNNWNGYSHKLKNVGNGNFEIFIDGENTLYDGCHVKAIVEANGQRLERIPLYIHRVEQDKNNHSWCGVVSDEKNYKWRNNSFKPNKSLFIYECHIGMAQDKEGVGSYKEFTENILPRVKKLGYNTIQIMAIMEHPYYGSFGYQVSSFFASSSRYGKINDLKELIDTAHGMGIAVLLDIVHSHAVKNTAEGINQFDGTSYQFFHEGPKGEHPAWGTMLFNYGKNEVIHFLLSNLKYWTEEFHFDGFRFDGVTSMIYHDHALGTAFTDYSKYFSLNTDTEAVTYLQLANELIHSLNKNAITIAEDMSAMPGMCLKIEDGGIGFDYRLAMGIPDLWIKLIKNTKDEFWNMWQIWGELTSRRPHEKYIGYAESHDQALVGDKTIIFRLCDKDMYTNMAKNNSNMVIDRGIALDNMIKFITLTTGGEGYLNFMGNEFGHPEWIDFPREGNNWSYFYCRRQWHLADDKNLKYEEIQNFDVAMVALAKKHRIYNSAPKSLFIDADKQVLVYKRGNLTFAFNFSPVNSYEGYKMKVDKKGNYKVLLNTDKSCFGGFDRVSEDVVYNSEKIGSENFITTYLPSRTAICFEMVK